MSGARSLGRAELAVLGVGLGIAVTAMALASRGAFALLFTLASFLFTLASLLFIGATSSHRTRWSRSWAAPRRGEASGLHVARLIVCCVVTAASAYFYVDEVRTVSGPRASTTSAIVFAIAPVVLSLAGGGAYGVLVLPQSRAR